MFPSLTFPRHHQRHLHEKGSFVFLRTLICCSCCLFLHLKSGSNVWDPPRHLHSNIPPTPPPSIDSTEQGLGQ